MEFHGAPRVSMVNHGNLYGLPQLPRASMDFHGWACMGFHGKFHGIPAYFVVGTLQFKYDRFLYPCFLYLLVDQHT